MGRWFRCQDGLFHINLYMIVPKLNIIKDYLVKCYDLILKQSPIWAKSFLKMTKICH